MRTPAVLSRRGAFGLAAMLAFVRPAAAQMPAPPLSGLSSEGRPVALRRGSQLTRMGADGSWRELSGTFGDEPPEAIMPLAQGPNVSLSVSGARADAGFTLPLREALPGPAPWGWDTLENVR